MRSTKYLLFDSYRGIINRRFRFSVFPEFASLSNKERYAE